MPNPEGYNQYKKKSGWIRAAGKAGLIAGGALVGGVLGARTLPRLLGKGRVLQAGESLAGKILYHHEGLTTPAQVIVVPATKKVRALTGQKFISLEQIIRRASKDKGIKGKVARAMRKVDEFLGIPQRHYAVGLGGGRVADITRGEGQRIIPVGKLGKDIRVHGEGRLVPKGTTLADEAKAINPKEAKALEGRYAEMKDWKKGDLCTIGDKNCEAYARGVGEGRKLSTQIRALKAGFLGGAAVGATPGVVMSIPRKENQEVRNMLQIINRWSDKAREASAETRRLKAKKKQNDSVVMMGLGSSSLLGASGAGAITQSRPANLVGLDTYYHGTSKEFADKIKKRGLRPSHGGKVGGTSTMGLTPSGFGMVEDQVRKETWSKASKGKIHVTSDKGIAKQFAGQHKISGKKGSVVKIVQSLADQDKLRQDPFFVHGEPAFTSTKVVPPSRIAGSGSSLRKARLLKDALRGIKSPKYAKAVLRSLGHLGYGLGAMGLAAYIAKNTVPKIKESNRLNKEIEASKSMIKNEWSDKAREAARRKRKQNGPKTYAGTGAKIGATLGAGSAALGAASTAPYSRAIWQAGRAAGASRTKLGLALGAGAALGGAVQTGVGAGIGGLIGRFIKRKNLVKNALQVINGGPGSGFHGHKGIPGHRGGSLAEGASVPAPRTSSAALSRILGPQLSETPQARARRQKNAVTRASKLADVLSSHADSLERKRKKKLLPLNASELRNLYETHQAAAENFKESALQATLLKVMTPEEQRARLEKAEYHQALADKYAARLGRKGSVGKAAGTMGKAFLYGALGGTPEQLAMKLGHDLGRTSADVAATSLRAGALRLRHEAGQTVTETKDLTMTEDQLKAAEALIRRSGKGPLTERQRAEFLKPNIQTTTHKKTAGEVYKAVGDRMGIAAASKARKLFKRAISEEGMKRRHRQEAARAEIRDIIEAQGKLGARFKAIGLSARGYGASQRKRGRKETPYKDALQSETEQKRAEKILRAQAEEAARKYDKEGPPTHNCEFPTANFAGQIRRETLHGRDYVVAPLTMIVPGVLAGSKGPLLYPEDEVGKNPNAWNGMPIVVNHPTKDGAPVEARSPGILEKYQIGTVFNAKYDGRLVAEGWFDVDRTKDVNSSILAQIMASKPIELSTGLYTDNEPFEGTWNGRAYKFVARNYRPDHLAILVGSRGACSIKDGCGVLVNSKGVNRVAALLSRIKRDHATV